MKILNVIAPLIYISFFSYATAEEGKNSLSQSVVSINSKPVNSSEKAITPNEVEAIPLNKTQLNFPQKEENGLCDGLKNMGLACNGISDLPRFSSIPYNEKSNSLESARFADKKLKPDLIKENFEALNQSTHAYCQNLKNEIARASRPNFSKIDQSTNTNFSDNGLFEMSGNVYRERTGELLGPVPMFENKKGRAQVEWEYMNKCGH